MQKYDISLKLLLRSSSVVVLRTLTGGAEVQRWLDVEIPEMRNSRVDLLGETAEGDLIHIELQSTNDLAMPLRMAEYYLRIYRLFGRFPRQMLLYVGDAPLRMRTELNGPGFSFEYTTMDIRDFDGDQLLESSRVGDNVIAILARLRDQQHAVRVILKRISGLDSDGQEAALSQLLRISGLRRAEEVIEKEASKMPVFNPIMDNKVLGREIKKGIAQGREEGRAEGAFSVIHRQIEARFGSVPDWAEKRLANYSQAELEDLGVQLMRSESLEELLK